MHFLELRRQLPRENGRRPAPSPGHSAGPTRQPYGSTTLPNPYSNPDGSLTEVSPPVIFQLDRCFFGSNRPPITAAADFGGTHPTFHRAREGRGQRKRAQRSSVYKLAVVFVSEDRSIDMTPDFALALAGNALSSFENLFVVGYPKARISSSLLSRPGIWLSFLTLFR
jgi:hypothetical protein